jgi:hypothetical protein
MRRLHGADRRVPAIMNRLCAGAVTNENGTGV